MLNWKHYVLLSTGLISILLVMLLPAIPQDVQYHNFADQRTMLGIPHFLNVMSNLPYLLFGIMGCLLILREAELSIVHNLKHAYLVFFIGVGLVCLGSGYYHWNPSSSTLFWDRLPMTLAFMSFFTVIFAEHVHKDLAQKIFLPLLLIGLVSVVYWYWTETLGQGDLRLYILVQFLPILLIPLILWLFTPGFSHHHYYWLIIACYVLAKVFELADEAVFDFLGFISGHSIKHLISSMAPFIFYLALKKRGLKSIN